MMGSSAMKSRMTLASSPGWLKLIAWAAPSMTTNAAKASYWLAISLIRAGRGHQRVTVADDHQGRDLQLEQPLQGRELGQCAEEAQGARHAEA